MQIIESAECKPSVSDYKGVNDLVYSIPLHSDIPEERKKKIYGDAHKLFEEWAQKAFDAGRRYERGK